MIAWRERLWKRDGTGAQAGTSVRGEHKRMPGTESAFFWEISETGSRVEEQ
jgi:hypothetical protein